MTVRRYFIILSVLLISLTVIAGIHNPHFFYFFLLLAPVVALGLSNIFQHRINILRNFPVIGALRYFLLSIRPQIRQYFVESDTEATPYSHEERQLVYNRAKRENDNLPFGTLKDVYKNNYEWLTHSLQPKSIPHHEMKVVFGGDDCKQPYTCSRLNVSAMSFGALGRKAVMALNKGAKLGGFAQNTGEGGLTPYHLKYGGDLIMQLGSGYFGCREKKSGKFAPELFKEKAAHEAVKMIELKLSQGAKPGHGGVLPAAKVTQEIAEIRHIERGVDCVSPAAHSMFSTPIEMMMFIATLRELSNGKPIGFKLCVGDISEFMAICKAMLATNIYPDFITVDGGEGGTGSAPLEFSNSLGMPLSEALILVHNCLVGINMRDKIKIIASGKIVTGFDIVKRVAIGADACNVARPMMFSLGCVQSRKCHLNTCPTGIATQNKNLMYGLDVDAKAQSVKNFHDATLASFREILGAAGLEHPDKLLPQHIWRRITADEGIKNYTQLYQYIPEGCLIDEPNFEWQYRDDWQRAIPESFSGSCEKTVLKVVHG